MYSPCCMARVILAIDLQQNEVFLCSECKKKLMIKLVAPIQLLHYYDQTQNPFLSSPNSSIPNPPSNIHTTGLPPVFTGP